MIDYTAREEPTVPPGPNWNHRTLVIERTFIQNNKAADKPLVDFNIGDIHSEVLPLYFIQLLNFLIVTDRGQLKLVKDRTHIRGGRSVFPVSELDSILSQINSGEW